MKCVICGKEFQGYGNNAMPVKEGRCCEDCNVYVVIPQRIKEGFQRKGRSKNK